MLPWGVLVCPLALPCCPILLGSCSLHTMQVIQSLHTGITPIAGEGSELSLSASAFQCNPFPCSAAPWSLTWLGKICCHSLL